MNPLNENLTIDLELASGSKPLMIPSTSTPPLSKIVPLIQASTPLPHSNSISKLKEFNSEAPRTTPYSVPNSPLILPQKDTRISSLPQEQPSAPKHHFDLGDSIKLHWKTSSHYFNWVTCFCVVGFDLEVGPVIEHVYPKFELSEDASKVIRFTSFPDSNSNIKDDICFSFRLDGPLGSRSENGVIETSISNSSSSYFSYVFFRQKPDASVRRGFFQKSVVLISRFAIHDLFLNLMRMVGPVVLEQGDVVLETVFEEIRRWPPPRKGKQQFPILGTIITSDFICSCQDSFPAQILSKPKNIPLLFPIFQPMIPKLWALWEIMLIGDPIAIITNCPSKCTEAVLGLISLILPLSAAIDFRTFITIQDPASKKIFKSSNRPRGLVALTNPFFFSSIRHWPHVIQLTPPSNMSHIAPAFKVEFKTGLTSKHRRVVSRDKSVLASVAKGICCDSTTSINDLLQKHFYELTERFLAPLNLYLDSLWPSSLTILSSFPPEPQPFNLNDCLQFIKDRPVSFPIKSILSDWIYLYRMFLNSNTFTQWLKRSLSYQSRIWQQRYIAILCATDLKQWASTQTVIDIQSLLSRIVSIKESSDSQITLSEAEYKQLDEQEAILHSILHVSNS